jgi:hypothetical protein
VFIFTMILILLVMPRHLLRLKHTAMAFLVYVFVRPSAPLCCILFRFHMPRLPSISVPAAAVTSRLHGGSASYAEGPQLRLRHNTCTPVVSTAILALPPALCLASSRTRPPPDQCLMVANLGAPTT